MKFLHCSDLHIGRKLHGYSMIDDQRDILEKMCAIAREKGVDAVLIAGDVYDTAMPNEDAVNLLDWFLTELSTFCKVYMIAGNHDSVERLSFAKEILSRQNVFVTGRYSGKAERFDLEDPFGPLSIFILPYTKASTVRRWCRDNGADADAIDGPDAAFALTMANTGADPGARNILVAHEFVTGKDIELSRSDSEMTMLPSVGGADCISSRLLEPFDYVALGHIHRPQRAGRDTVLYCGSPLKYSESEIDDEKHAVIVEVRGKGDVSVETVPLVPKRRMVRLTGTIEEILSRKDAYGDEYVLAELTEPADKATDRLAEVYRVLGVKRLYDRGRADTTGLETSVAEIRAIPPQELFARFFEERTGEPLSEYQKKVLDDVVESLGRGQQ